MTPANAANAAAVADNFIVSRRRTDFAAYFALVIVGILLFTAPACVLWLWPFWVGGY